MNTQPGNIEACEECETHINGAVCSDDCEIYQDLKAEADFEMKREEGFYEV